MRALILFLIMVIIVERFFFFFYRKMESDDDYYTVSECLSSKVSSYGSCTPTASDQDEEVNMFYKYFVL